jgi:hypothetical protein
MVKHDVLHALKTQILSQRSLSIRRYGRVVGNLTSGLLQTCPSSGNSRSVGKSPHVELQAMNPQIVSVRLSLLLKGEHTGAFTPKWLAMLGTGRAGTQRAAEYGSSPIDPTTPAALEHCRAFLPFLPLRFEAD